MLRLLRYEHAHREVERVQAQQIEFANIKARKNIIFLIKVAI